MYSKSMQRTKTSEKKTIFLKTLLERKKSFLGAILFLLAINLMLSQFLQLW